MALGGLAGAALIAAALLVPSTPAESGPVVDVETGALSGSVDDGVESWKGIPFAAAPVGDLRWRAPQPAARWEGTRDARDYGNDCMQRPAPSDAAPPGTEPSEDCLYLNVWRPAGDTARPRPVVVWIYGGGFVNGGSSPPTYTGAELARQGVVVASFNYRLGRFGTFAHPQLTKEDADGGRLGNYGIMDQIAGLEWVKRNIAAFGGDPNDVTVMGESAGGMSINMLLTSPLAQGLMQRAIIMSGGDGTQLEPTTIGDAERLGLNFAETQGISSQDPEALTKLRDVSAERIRGDLSMERLFDESPRDFASPFVDGTVIVDQRAAYRAGAFTRVPVMIGATKDDLGGRDGFMIAGARDVATVLARQGVPVYSYRFSYVPGSVDPEDGALHATDIPFFLNTERIRYGDGTTASDEEVGRTASAYVVNFARTGDPNGPELPKWPRFDPAADEILDFTTGGDAVAGKDPWGP
ncbi:carboxylesterase/lipase family protein [Mycolicibacterium sediminis]|uniref:carboxylesterase/lipase family protein n=1 Tax=Mycolicibacterium sediminis TaxID=1286180 RepID=UPI0018D790A3|nr:carboxylesterase family protein [Mycolicibacterium sediminis]